LLVSSLKKLFSFDKGKEPTSESATVLNQEQNSQMFDPVPLTVQKASTAAPPLLLSNRPNPESDASVVLTPNEIEIIEHLPTEDPQIPVHTQLNDKPDTFVGTVLTGQYKIQQLIGKGGMGRVYKAYQQTVDRTVAIKILNSTMVANPDLVRRFRQEARAASQLSHPNTITIHDFGHTGGNVLFIVMEYLQGFSMSKLLKQSPTPERVLKIMLQVCGSLGEAHQYGIVHRDLKPANILLCRIGNEDEYVKVLDFGIAKIATANTNTTQSNLIFGTPKYISPEQLSGETVDSRSDIFSLGILMYELLSGVPPFIVDSPVGYFYKHVNTEPRSLCEVHSRHQISRDLGRVVMKMLAKRPADRFQKADDLIPHFVEILHKDYSTVAAGFALAGPFINRNLQPRTERNISTSELIRLRKELSENPDEITILKSLAQHYESNGELQKSIQDYIKIAEIHIHFERYGKAAPILSKVLDINKNNIKARVLLAKNCSHLGNYEEAIEHFKNIVLVFEKNNDREKLIAALLHLASAYSDIDDQQNAKLIWMRIKKLSDGKTVSGTTTSVQSARNQNIVGIPKTEKENKTKTPDSILPYTKPVYVHLDNAARLIRNGKYQEALTAVRKALILDPKNKTALRTASIILNEGQSALSPDECAWLNILLPAKQHEKVSNRTIEYPLSDISEELFDILKENDLVLVKSSIIESAYCKKKCEIGQFAISRTPITNEQFCQYIQDTGKIPPGDWFGSNPPTEKKQHPVVGISIKQALSYANWRGLRLPTLLEWECAARGDDGRAFPWGNEWDHKKCHCRENGANSTCPVTTYKEMKSPYGCIDMIGNVWEWTTPDHRVTPPDRGYAWVIGGSYKHPCEKNGHIARTSVSEESAYGYLGFRCAIDVRST
jgi:serine/threonine protein kinase